MTTKRTSRALQIVQEHFPNVTSVVDAKKPLLVQVTKRDINSAQVRKHGACAMAVACKREMQADGMIVSISTAYVIKGNKATRYKVPGSVGREITAFDRGVQFSEGEYALSIPNYKLGSHNQATVHTETGNGKPKQIVHRHQTDDIRTVLGAK